ncbi:hypothetical protein [Nostoc sp.]
MTSATPKVLHPVYQGSPWAAAIHDIAATSKLLHSDSPFPSL